jgi:hypothetical protein
MTRKNKLPILRQGSRTCETKITWGDVGNEERKYGKDKRVAIVIEMRDALGEDQSGARLSNSDGKLGHCGVGGSTKLKKGDIKDVGTMDHEDEADIGGEGKKVSHRAYWEGWASRGRRHWDRKSYGKVYMEVRENRG